METVLFWAGAAILTLIVLFVFTYAVWLCYWFVQVTRHEKVYAERERERALKFHADTELQLLKATYEQREEPR